MSKYRKMIFDKEVILEEPQDQEVINMLDGATHIIPLDVAVDIVEELESKINDILDKLQEIKGLSEIDDIKLELKIISDDLY